MSKYTTIVLPRECIGQDEVLFVNLLHPRTGRATKFVKHGYKIWELSSIDGTNLHRKRNLAEEVQATTRSLLFEADFVVSSGAVLVATPINPLYFVLPTLYTNADKFLSADQIQDLSESRLPEECETIGPEIFEDRLVRVCELLVVNDEKLYKFSQKKFVAYLDTICKRVTVPNGMLEHQMELLRPLEIGKTVPEEIVGLVTDQIVTHYVCAYLCDELCQLYVMTKNYEPLENYRREIQATKKRALEEQERLIASHGNGTKRKAVGLPARNNGVKKRTGPTSLQKANIKNNKSLMDMFRKTV